MESEFWPYLAGAATLTAVLLYVLTWTKILVPRWIYDDKDKEVDELKKALALERQRGDTAVVAATATRDVLLALQSRSTDVVQKKD
jgi:hypothetical protein